jgi:poly-gamma-glutamate synthesis protein (capsule biosynthesis protein)
MLGRLVNNDLKLQPPTYPWGDTLPLFQEADVRLCNLECAISDRGTRWSAPPKMFHFRSDAKNVAILQAAQNRCSGAIIAIFGLVSLASLRW